MPDPTQIADDLRGEFRGRLAFDAVRRGLYATDASPFHVTPLGVAFPEDAEDLAALVKYCHDHALPVVPRGAGTGVAGESLGPGLVVDLSAEFRGILHVGADTATVEPGVVLAELNAALAKVGRRFAPDPASGASCTVGGMVATNASGGNAVRHGYTRDHVRGLGVVWDDGTRDTLLSPGGLVAAGLTVRTLAVVEGTAKLLRANRDLIHLARPQTPYNRCGYVLHDVLTDAGPDLPRLLCGSEGTLGFVTEATVATVPLAGGTCLTLLGFPTLDAAVGAAADLPRFEPTTADLLDRRLLSLSGRGADSVPPAVGAALLVTFEADTEREAAERARSAVEALKASHKLVVLAEPACDPDGVARIRAVREAAVNGLYGIGRGPRPAAFVEDVGVPPAALAEFLSGTQDVLKRFELSASFLVHALAGQVHTRPLIDLADPADRAKMWPVAEAVHALALALGGTVSTQHGTGLARTPWVERQYGPVLPVFRELKRVFDPKNVLNPGKIVGPDPSRPAWPLRFADTGQETGARGQEEPAAGRAPLLVWKDVEPTTEAGKCSGCGDCRPRGGAARMCPAFTAAGLEEAAPRAMANLVRGLADLGSDEAQPVVSRCVNCKMCRDECPSRVDVPRLMIEAKARRHADHGLDRVSWVLARADRLAAFASRLAPLSNAVLGNRSARWVIEKLIGLSRRRRLPKLAHQPFLRSARGERRGPVTPGAPKVAYFADTYANVFDPSVGAAAVAVLRHNGVTVVVPPRQVASGAAPLAQGDLETARELAVRNVRALADYARDGYRIVCSEPTAAMTLSQDYLLLLDDADAAAVAAATTELTTFLGGLHAAGQLRTDFRALDLALGHHVPCHLKALRGPVSGPGLLGLIPGLTVQPIDVGCSGMAGPWGLAEANYDASLRAGRRMIEAFDRPGLLLGATECGSCRLQMQEGTGKRAFHPVQYLAHAYGLLPDLGARLRSPLGELVSD
ncbi:MAG: FAD-linked oxidase C-terminal domain-containing protein [Gemmataceae bacterium]